MYIELENYDLCSDYDSTGPNEWIDHVDNGCLEHDEEHFAEAYRDAVTVLQMPLQQCAGLNDRILNETRCVACTWEAVITIGARLAAQLHGLTLDPEWEQRTGPGGRLQAAAASDTLDDRGYDEYVQLMCVIHGLEGARFGVGSEEKLADYSLRELGWRRLWLQTRWKSPTFHEEMSQRARASQNAATGVDSATDPSAVADAPPAGTDPGLSAPTADAPGPLDDGVTEEVDDA